MVFHRMLDEVFAARSHSAALRVLQDAARGFTGREISRQAGMTHRSALKALTRLEDLGVVKRTRGGRDHIFVLNRESVLVREGILPVFELERRMLDRALSQIARALGTSVESIILFGSVARREETVESDLDLCVLVASAGHKREAQRRAHAIAPRIREEFGARLAPIFFSVAEFRKGVRRRKELFAGIIRDGKLVAGRPLTEVVGGKRHH